jgi:hypothetical protein
MSMAMMYHQILSWSPYSSSASDSLRTDLISGSLDALVVLGFVVVDKAVVAGEDPRPSSSPLWVRTASSLL